ncbi:phosphatase PAP2 family protein [Bacillus subtilis]|uniref:phosphatase PAP2 family protein n=1 Tax=Bacillus subtilis TaxID=1423 RepID=UPI0024ACDE57|nr:phosphatase PAP2 family protein [Bacillus subtilis]MDI6563439.1 phosphatase PAP2 family protein [Bacillus subtilis]
MSYWIGYRLGPAAIQKAFASRGVLLAVIVLTFLWTVFKGQGWKIELSFLFFLVIGGELYEEGIRRLFHFLHPVHAPLESHVLYPFPSEQTFNGICHFWFLCLSFCSSFSQGASANCCVFLFIIVLFLIGLSRVYVNEQYPSDVAAGCAFGSVWLGLNVLVMELFRFSRRFTKLRNEPN